jgi:hypothetical protein
MGDQIMNIAKSIIHSLHPDGPGRPFRGGGAKDQGERQAGGLPGIEGPADPAVRHRLRFRYIQQIHQGISMAEVAALCAGCPILEMVKQISDVPPGRMS